MSRRCPQLLLGPVNISDAGEMGGFGCRAFHPAPTGSRELRWDVPGMRVCSVSKSNIHRAAVSKANLFVEKLHISVYLSLIVEDLQHLRWHQVHAIEFKRLELQGNIGSVFLVEY